MLFGLDTLPISSYCEAMTNTQNTCFCNHASGRCGAPLGAGSFDGQCERCAWGWVDGQCAASERSLLTGEVITTEISAASTDLSGVFESLSDSALVSAIGNAAAIPSRAKNLQALLAEATRRANL